MVDQGEPRYVGVVHDGFSWNDAASSDDDYLDKHPRGGPAWLWPMEWLGCALSDPGHVRRHPAMWLLALLRGQPSAREYEACDPDSLPWTRALDDDDQYHPMRFRDWVRRWWRGWRPMVVLRLTLECPSWPLEHPGKWLRALFLPPKRGEQRLFSGWAPPPDLDDSQM
jgi:hypothetical protein